MQLYIFRKLTVIIWRLDRRALRPPNAPTERGVAFDRAGRGRGGRSPIGYRLGALDGTVAKNILATFHSSNDQMFTEISCMISEFLQQSHLFLLRAEGKRLC